MHLDSNPDCTGLVNPIRPAEIKYFSKLGSALKYKIPRYIAKEVRCQIFELDVKPQLSVVNLPFCLLTVSPDKYQSAECFGN